MHATVKDVVIKFFIIYVGIIYIMLDIFQTDNFAVVYMEINNSNKKWPNKSLDL